MSPSTNIVPSRDALRALRSLAFSPQAAFVGAVGSVCGLVVIHSHQRRKVRLAEKILDTKRTIHVLSQGRGKAQANRMFEAAEKGEDFTLHHGRPRKPQKRRAYSASAVAESTDEETVFKPWPHLDNHIETPRSNPAGSRDTKTSASTLDGRLVRSKSRGENLDTSSNDKRKHVRGPLPHALPTRIAQSTTDPPVLWKPKKYDQIVPGRWSETVAKAQARLKERWQSTATTTLIPEPPSESSLSPQKQVSTDLNPIPQEAVTSLADIAADISFGLSAEESIFFNFVFGKPSPDSIFETNVFQSLQPWDSESSLGQDETAESVENGHQAMEQMPVHSKPSQVTSSVSADEAAQPASLEATLQSKWISDDQNLQQRLQVSGGEENYHKAFNSIAQAFTKEGRFAALAALEKCLMQHCSQLKDDNLDFVMLLLPDTARFLTYASLGPIIKRLVRNLLATDMATKDAVRLLYPGFGFNRAQGAHEDSQYYYLAQQYVNDSCQLIPDIDEKVMELGKILQISSHLDIPPVEALMVPVLRALTAAGRTKEAHELYDALASMYDMKITFYSTSIIMRGYALAGEWPQAKALMEKTHTDDLSWKKVYGYSAMFSGTIEQYASTYPPEKVYNFVEECIAEYGLVPTSLVTNRLLQVCLRARRYDLIRKWILRIQRDFPYLATGVQSQQLAVNVGQLWKEMKASCDDILAGLRALSTNSLDDPFAKAFRGISSEAVQRDLHVRIAALEKHATYKMPRYKTIDDVQALLKDVKQLVTNVHSRGFTSRTRLLADDLIQQTKAVVEIDQLFSGSYEAQKQVGWDEKYLNQQRRVTNSNFSGMPHALRVARLPNIKAVITIVEKSYLALSQRGQPIDHRVLAYAVDRLTKQMRKADAYALLDMVFHSQWAKASSSGGVGLPFSTDLFTTWLQLTIDIMSSSKYRAVLWRIIDAGPELNITAEMILVARIGAHKTHDSRMRRGTPEAIAETEYLRWRLKHRRANQKGTRLKWSEWKGLHDGSEVRFKEMELQKSEGNWDV